VRIAQRSRMDFSASSVKFQRSFSGLPGSPAQWLDFECNKIPCFVATKAAETYANALKSAFDLLG
jgi:hypothetical protein